MLLGLLTLAEKDIFNHMTQIKENIVVYSDLKTSKNIFIYSLKEEGKPQEKLQTYSDY